MNFDFRHNGASKVAIVALMALMVAFSWLDPIDSQANQQVESGLKRALVTFALARALNGAISVLQGTELSAQPFGFGLTVTVGQVLDPVNDLVEKFSDLMLVASIAFGVQKVLLAVGASWFISFAFSVTVLGWCYLYLTKQWRPIWLTRTLVALAIARFAIPVALVGSGMVFDSFLKDTYDHSHATIQSVNSDLAAAKESIGENSSTAIQNSAGEMARKPGFFGELLGQKKEGSPTGEFENSEPTTAQPAPVEKRSLWSKFNPKKQLENLKQIAEKSIERIIDLMVVFVLQTILLPLLLIWLFASALRGLGGSGQISSKPHA